MSFYTRLRNLCVCLLLLILSFSQTAWAQEITLNAPQAVYAGQPFRVVFTINGKYSDFKPPVWSSSFAIQGPYEETMRQFNMVNGQTTSSESTSKVYICQITTPGAYEIPAASANVNGKVVKTEPQKIEVLAGGRAGGGAQPQASNPNQGGNTQGETNDNTSDLLVVIQLSQNEVYQGQPVVATMKIFTRLDLADFENLQFPDFKGFWAKEIETPRQVRFNTEVYNGREYHAGLLRQYALYPQKSGELQIDPLKVTVRYRVRGARQSFFDEFMGTFRTDSRAIESAPRKIKVLPLPAGAPSSFTGAVGKFDIKAKVDNSKLKTNEALSYTLTVTGAGNMQLLQKPELQLPSTVEVFPPKVVENYSLRNGVQTGSVTYEYTLIPRAPGKLQLPAFEFSYFDPQARAYKTSTGQSFEIDVEADSTQNLTTVTGAISKEDIQYLGQDIRHIFVGKISLHPLTLSLVGSFFWWLIFLLFVAIFAALWVILRRRQEYFADLTLVRGRRAGGVARKRLKRAKSYMNVDAAQFYIELERAVWGYFSDKLAIELSDLSSDGLRVALQEQKVPTETIEKIQRVISQCEYARYAPSALQGSQDEIYADTLDAFEELERWLKVRGQK